MKKEEEKQFQAIFSSPSGANPIKKTLCVFKGYSGGSQTFLAGDP